MRALFSFNALIKVVSPLSSAIFPVLDDGLYLVGLVDACNQPISVDFVFGGRPLPVRADGFTERLANDHGALLCYVHMGWGTKYARKQRVYIQQGRVVANRNYDQTKLFKRRFP